MLSNINQRKIFSAVFSFNQLQNTKVLFKRDKKIYQNNKEVHQEAIYAS